MSGGDGAVEDDDEVTVTVAGPGATVDYRATSATVTDDSGTRTAGRSKSTIVDTVLEPDRAVLKLPGRAHGRTMRQRETSECEATIEDTVLDRDEVSVLTQMTSGR